MDSTIPINTEFATSLRTIAFNPDDKRAWQVLNRCPRYRPTPLLCMSDDGIGVWVKDESQRLGLGSFKALGGIYAVAQLLSDALEKTTGARPQTHELLDDSARTVAARLTFVCASAGNHGLAVATGAQLFGAQARIHLSATVPEDFGKRLEGVGAVVCRSGDTYEQSLELAEQDANEVGGVLLADGSWQGYTYPPSLVMEGYTAIARELHDQFTAKNRWPSDIYLQAGVGGMAAAVTLMIRKYWPAQPRIVIVEPVAADCLAISASAGKMVEATGPVSNMGRLDCKAASLLAFDALSVCDVEYMTISDSEAEVAVRSLDYLGLSTSPSGAAGFAAWQRDRSLDRSAGQHPLIIMSEQAVS
ncbi:MAG: pyridoxal-phosphate dependent enzyme [Granulosicoccus sp.]